MSSDVSYTGFLGLKGEYTGRKGLAVAADDYFNRID